MSQLQDHAPQTKRDAASEDIHLRNYDMEQSHRVWINVVADGEQLLETTRRLRPGGVRSIEDTLPPGEYDIEVGIDGLRREVERCRVGDAPERTVVVEMGNGIVSITEGLH